MFSAYQDALFADKLLKQLAQLGPKNVEAVRAILERYALCTIEADPNSSWLRIELSCYEKMRSELSDLAKKRKLDETVIVQTIESIFAERKAVPDQKSKLTPWKFDREKNIMQIGELQYPFSTARHDKLSREYPKQIFIKAFTKLQSTLPGGQQWAVPRKYHSTLAKQGFPITLEAFASPFNRTAEQYCSAFIEDRPMGSLGSFFELELDQLNFDPQKTITILINPPFIESFLQRAAEKAQQFIADAQKSNLKILIIFNGPNWPDSAFFKSLDESDQTTKEKIVLARLQHSYTDYTKYANPKTIKAVNNYGTILFVLANFKLSPKFNPTLGYLEGKK